MKAAVTATMSEAGWWCRRLGSALRRFPGQLAVAVAAVWLTWPALSLSARTVMLAACLGLCVWLRLGPVSFHRLIAEPLTSITRRRWLRRHWAAVAIACDLAAYPSRPEGHRRGEAVPSVPRLKRIRTAGPRVRAKVRPLMGQTFERFEEAGEQLRTAVGASRIRVDPLPTNEIQLTFTIGDALATPFAARRPRHQDRTVPAGIWMGRAEDGSDWRLPVGPHTLVAGCSGAGKGSVFWSLAFGLGASIRAGLTRLHGIDLKGGMEILMGADLFSTRATSPTEAVAVLEGLVREMQQRTHRYAGLVRAHAATIEEPLQVVMIDELAALTAYCPDRSLQRRAEMAINLLCSQGRAPGFMVFACLQDPRKEVIPSRGLFTQMVGLRLKDISETAMVLGEAAVASGAHCHRITRETPGMGYVTPEDGGYPIRVRAGHASDHAIRAVAEEFASPHQQPIPAVERTDADEVRSLQRRARRGSEDA